MTESVVILGGGLSGLIAADICSQLGIDSILIEKTNILGGGNKSIKDKDGNVFDYGYHTLDYNRSFLTTKYFEKVLKNNFRKFKLCRGIVIKNYIIPYNENLSKWPIELRKLLKTNLPTDTIQGRLNRNTISKIYGKKFTEFAFDEILNSYPSIKWSIRNGGNEEDFFGLIYPWFFPKTNKNKPRTSEWDQFHDQMRQNLDHYVLYPKSNGFQGFMDAIIKDIDRNYCKIRKNIKNIEFKINPKTKDIQEIKINNNTISGNLFFWCSSPIALSRILNIDLNEGKLGKPQKIIFGNFVLEKEIKSKFHEILVGSLDHKINRISFPGKISKKQDNLVQVEYSFPDKQFEMDKNFWKKSWIKSLKELEILKHDNKIKKFTIVEETRGFVSKYNWEFLTNMYKEKILKSKGKNLIVPSFNIGPENINRVIPDVILNTVNSLYQLNRK